MRSYVIRAGSHYVLEQETVNKHIWQSETAIRDLIFEENDLKPSPTGANTHVFVFHVGNKIYYAHRDSVNVYANI